MIIDIHAHTSEHPMRGLHTASASIATLEAEAARHGISRVNLVATYFPLKGTGVHNLDLLARIEGRPLFTAFGSLDIMNRISDDLAELEGLSYAGKILGLKLYPGYQGFSPDEPRLNRVYALAKRHRLPVMLHGGELHHCCPAEKRRLGPRPCRADHCRLDDFSDMAHPRHVEGPARAFPQVKFVVSHLANPHFAELREVMARCPNVFTDISGQFVSGKAGEDTAEYRAFIASEIQGFARLPNGRRRIAFGTDFPIQSFGDSLELVRLAVAEGDRELKENILWRNAMRIMSKSYRP